MNVEIARVTASPKITVYVPSRNYGKFLGRCLASIEAQTESSWELIIFDEASKDNTLQLAEEFQAGCSNRVHVVTNSHPRGLRACANQALELARGQYIIRVDADDYLDENAFLVLSHFLDKHPEIGVVFPNWIYVDENENFLGIERRKKIGRDVDVLDLPAHGACTMTRKRVLKAIGGYDLEFDAQDGHELWIKTVYRHGVSNIETPLFYYRRHSSSMSVDSERLHSSRRAIKSKLVNSSMGPVRPKVAAILPVKNSYPDLPDIAFVEVAGKTLLDRALDLMEKVEGLTIRVVSSDDVRVLEHAQRRQSVIAHLRDSSLSNPDLHLAEVINQVVGSLENEHDIHPDIIAVLNLHAPLTRPAHVREALDTLLVYDVDQVMSTYEDQDLHFRHARSGLEPLNVGVLKGLRLEREALFAWNGAVQVMWRESLKRESLFSGRIGHIVMSEEDSLQAKSPVHRERVEETLRRRERSAK